MVCDSVSLMQVCVRVVLYTQKDRKWKLHCADSLGEAGAKEAQIAQLGESRQSLRLAVAFMTRNQTLRKK